MAGARSSRYPGLRGGDRDLVPLMERAIKTASVSQAGVILQLTHFSEPIGPTLGGLVAINWCVDLIHPRLPLWQFVAMANNPRSRFQAEIKESSDQHNFGQKSDALECKRGGNR